MDFALYLFRFVLMISHKIVNPAHTSAAVSRRPNETLRLYIFVFSLGDVIWTRNKNTLVLFRVAFLSS